MRKIILYGIMTILFAFSVFAISTNNAANIVLTQGTVKPNNAANINYVTTPTSVCTGTENCIITCDTNITESINMNNYNITFTGTGTTYLQGNITGYTKISVGACNIKLNGNRIY